MEASARKGLAGLTALGRGGVLLFASSQDSATKMLKTLAKFEAVAQVTKGFFDLYTLGRDTMKAYTLSVEAAAVAHRALAAAEALSSGGAGAAGKVAGKVAGKAAGSAVGGAAGSAAAGAFTTGLGMVATGVKGLVGAVTSVTGILVAGVVAWAAVLDKHTGAPGVRRQVLRSATLRSASKRKKISGRPLERVASQARRERWQRSEVGKIN